LGGWPWWTLSIPERKCPRNRPASVGLIARSMDGQTHLQSGSYRSGSTAAHHRGPEERKTLGSFYQMLSAMLVSVPTFPVNPALYGRVARDVDGHIVAGQIREIDAQTLAKTTLKTSFLRHIVEAVENEAPTSILELERRAFSQTALPYTPFGDGRSGYTIPTVTSISWTSLHAVSQVWEK